MWLLSQHYYFTLIALCQNSVLRNESDLNTLITSWQISLLHWMFRLFIHFVLSFSLSLFPTHKHICHVPSHSPTCWNLGCMAPTLLGWLLRSCIGFPWLFNQISMFIVNHFTRGQFCSCGLIYLVSVQPVASLITVNSRPLGRLCLFIMCWNQSSNFTKLQYLLFTNRDLLNNGEST